MGMTVNAMAGMQAASETKLLKSVREPILALLTAMTGLKNLCMKS